MENDIRLDSLPGTKYRIYQDKTFFCYGIDAVLLADFAAENAGTFENAVDLCCGNGAVPLLLSWKLKQIFITGIEIQKEMADLAEKSVKTNKITNIRIIEGDICKIEELMEKSSCGIVTVNPPYMKKGNGRSSPNIKKAVAREELLCTLDDVIRAASYLLMDNGKLFMIHRPERLHDIQKSLEKYGLTMEKIRLVVPKYGEKATMIMIQAEKSSLKKNTAKPIEDIITVYGSDGKYTDKVKKIYGLK